MEIKCDICGTINDGNTNFCKGCFQKLDGERKENIIKEEPKVVVAIEDEEPVEIPWKNEEIEQVVSPIDEIINAEIAQMNNESEEETLDDIQPIEQVTSEINETLNENLENNDLNESISTVDEDDWEIEQLSEPLNESNNLSNIEEVVSIPVEEKPLIQNDNWIEEISSNNLEESTKDEIIEPIAEIDENVSLESNSLNQNDDWNDNWNAIEEEKEEQIPNSKFIFKFLFYYIISAILSFGLLIFLTKFLNKIFDPATSEIVEFSLYRIISLLILIISTKLTFNNKVPKMTEINKISFKILCFIALPSMLIQLFILGFIEDTKVLMFIIGIMLSLIILVIFLNYLRKIIKLKNNDRSDDKTLFIYGIINIIIIIMLLFGGIYARKNDLDMPKINYLYKLFENSSKNEEIIAEFINQIELNIIKNQTEIDNYELPQTINDINYAKYNDILPDSMEINLSKEGAIINGNIVYRGITYKYDGKNIKAE